MPRAERQPLYYCHGFASAIPADWSESPKISAVAAFCRATGRDFRPQNVDYGEAERRCDEILDDIEADVERVPDLPRPAGVAVGCRVELAGALGDEHDAREGLTLLELAEGAIQCLSGVSHHLLKILSDPSTAARGVHPPQLSE